MGKGEERLDGNNGRKEEREKRYVKEGGRMSRHWKIVHTIMHKTAYLSCSDEDGPVWLNVLLKTLSLVEIEQGASTWQN